MVRRWVVRSVLPWEDPMGSTMGYHWVKHLVRRWVVKSVLPWEVPMDSRMDSMMDPRMG